MKNLQHIPTAAIVPTYLTTKKVQDFLRTQELWPTPLGF
jgi:hypothetical protein